MARGALSAPQHWQFAGPGTWCGGSAVVLLATYLERTHGMRDYPHLVPTSLEVNADGKG